MNDFIPTPLGVEQSRGPLRSEAVPSCLAVLSTKARVPLRLIDGCTPTPEDGSSWA